MHGSQVGIRELCRRIATTATQVAAYYDENQLPEPTFGPDCPDIPSSVEYERLRISLNQTADDLMHLVNGPKNFIRTFTCSHYDLAAFQVALEFNFFENVLLECLDHSPAYLPCIQPSSMHSMLVC